MRLKIETCGTHSIMGCIAEKVLETGEAPTKITIDIGNVMKATDVHKELSKAQVAFEKRPFVIELGNVDRDFFKEDIARDPVGTVCFS